VHCDTVSVSKLDIQKMIDEADLDGDGKIDYDEFLVMLREKTRSFFKAA
jgi:calcium-dependent protein kinase